MRKLRLSVLLLFTMAILYSCESRSSREMKKYDQDDSPSLKQNNRQKDESRDYSRSSPSNPNVVKWRDDNGVKIISVEINGVAMDFIFDTGASIISISATEASFLIKQGTLTDDDLLGTVNFTDANGDISEGTVVLLRTVKIGNKLLHDVEASIVHNSVAPLLLGQSALSSFGTISIDNVNNEIRFE
jgi:aspartyl protease family protein